MRVPPHAVRTMMSVLADQPTARSAHRARGRGRRWFQALRQRRTHTQVAVAVELVAIQPRRDERDGEIAA